MSNEKAQFHWLTAMVSDTGGSQYLRRPRELSIRTWACKVNTQLRTELMVENSLRPLVQCKTKINVDTVSLFDVDSKAHFHLSLY